MLHRYGFLLRLSNPRTDCFQTLCCPIAHHAQSQLHKLCFRCFIDIDIFVCIGDDILNVCEYVYILVFTCGKQEYFVLVIWLEQHVHVSKLLLGPIVHICALCVKGALYQAKRSL